MKSKEHDLQVTCVKWFRLQYPKLSKLLFAVPNGTNKSPYMRGYFKAEGLTAGVPDLLFLYHSRLFAIEMKIPGSYLNANQKELHPIWNDHLATEVYVVRTFEEFKKIIESIIL